MRKIFAILLSLTTATLQLNAQTQHGYVKTKGRLASNGTVITGTRISGATVHVKGRSAVLSQSNGTFSFPIPAQSYYLQSVQKQGYVLTDPDVLSNQYAYSENPLVLVLETPSQQVEDKLAAEKKIRRTLQRQLQEKEDEIESLKAQQKLTDEEYRKKMQEIYTQQESNEKLIGDMADRYSRMDFDEVNEFNRRISQLILDGNLTEADSLLNTKGDINTRIAALRQHQEADAKAEQEINKKQKKLEKSKELTQKELEDLAQDCYSKFEIFKLQHNIDSACYHIELRASLDTTNVEWQINAGDFLRKYMALYKKALSIYKRAARISSLLFGQDSEEYAKACGGISDTYREMAQYDEADRWIEKAISIQSNNNDGVTLALADIYKSKSSLCYSIGDYSAALDFSQRSLAIKEQMLGKNSEFVATDVENIGVIYMEMGKYDLALVFLERALNIQEFGHGEVHSVELASIYNSMGMVYKRKKDFPKAIDCFEKAISYGGAILGEGHPDIGMRYNNLGSIYDDMGELDLAFDNYNHALHIVTNVYGEIHPRVAIVLNNIGSVYFKRKDIVRSLEIMNKVVTIEECIYGKDNSDIAISYANISALYMANEDYVHALEYAEKAYLVFNEKLGEEHPNTKILKEKIEELKKKIRE